MHRLPIPGPGSTWACSGAGSGSGAWYGGRIGGGDVVAQAHNRNGNRLKSRRVIHFPLIEGTLNTFMVGFLPGKLRL